MRIIIVFTTAILLLIFASCDRQQKENECFTYPKQIDSLGIRELYDTARLYLFTWLCDRKVDAYYRGQFTLEYKSFFLRNDSIELFFSHFLPKELQDSAAFSEYQHRTSIAFNIKTKQKLWAWDIKGFFDALEPNDVRFKSPDSKVVIDFIRSNKRILNQCFLELVRKSNLLVE